MSSTLPPEALDAARRNAEAAPPLPAERRAALKLILWGAQATPPQPKEREAA